MKASTREALAGYCFLLPNLLGFFAFTAFPVVASLILAFYQWDMIDKRVSPEFIEFENFKDLLGFHRDEAGALQANDRYFWQYTGNTIFLMLVIPVSMFCSLLLAVAMNQKLKGIVLLRTVYFLPTICSGVAILLLWRWIYNADYGLLNAAIAKFAAIFHLSIQGPNWLGDPAWAKPALMLMGLWIEIGGYSMILYLAALQGIPRELYEAADIDGARGWQRFWAITVPMVSPTTFFILVMSVIMGFQGGFTAAYVMTGGGPAGATTTIEYYIYNNAYQWFKMGYASSIAWVLFVVILVITLLNWRFGGRRVNY
jgi:multiple sugar transport system permease protein